MTKKYQTKTGDASALAMPEQVSVAMDEIAADMREGLLALAVGAGLQVMGQLMEADVSAVCGPRGKHDRNRAATRHGNEAGSVTLGGRRVPVSRPRAGSRVPDRGASPSVAAASDTKDPFRQTLGGAGVLDEPRRPGFSPGALAGAAVVGC